ncbi:hypothetical protein [Pandoraea communis]|uniref:hypothetical protein n=1 Tax=Pandoraea communis TaxID=2508297 RepID=UPI0025A547BF|nr:hypothetical protein [Pandoraea communis]MDM8356647.1 hypothetical protein [Pandoraea communis]
MSPIENSNLLVETIKAALAAKGGSVGLDIEATVKSAVKSVVDADRAYRDYIKELSDKAQQRR